MLISMCIKLIQYFSLATYFKFTSFRMPVKSVNFAFSLLLTIIPCEKRYLCFKFND